MSKFISTEPILTRYILLVLKLFISTGTSVYCISQINSVHQKRLHYRCNADCGKLSSFSSAWGMDMGEIRFYEKTVFAWNPPIRAQCLLHENAIGTLLILVPREMSENHEIVIFRLQNLRETNLRLMQSNANSSHSSVTLNDISVMDEIQSGLDGAAETGSGTDNETSVDGALLAVSGTTIALMWGRRNKKMSETGRRILRTLRRCRRAAQMKASGGEILVYLITAAVIFESVAGSTVTKPYEVTVLLIGPNYDDYPLGDDQVMTPLQTIQYAAQATVEDLEYRNTILSQAKINILPLNNWDERYLGYENSSLIDSGGYSAAALYDVITSNNNNAALKSSLENNGINVVAAIGVTESEDDVNAAIEALKRNKSKVIFLLLDTDFLKQLYFRAARNGLVGPGYVWVGFSELLNNEKSDNDTELSNYTFDERMHLSKGYIYTYSESTYPLFANFRFRNLYWRIVEKAYNISDFVQTDKIDTYTIYNGEQLNDCFKILMLGFDQYLSERPDLTPDDLVKQEYRRDFSAKLFSTTGYSGATMDFIEFDDDRELKSPLVFYIADETDLRIGNSYYNKALFGRTTLDGNNYFELRPPIFYDNTSIWPLDYTTGEFDAAF
ncbi:hypothetical protein HDU97_010423 [Phlyctochytrium planicorne]|nr:hypothetical protein HDU97_010423 [Phlyctochytrium planicorne]